MQWAYWTFHRRQVYRPSCLKRITCRAYMRHLRQAWLRFPPLYRSPLPDPAALPWWRDLRTHALKEARKEDVDSCTPLNPQQVQQMLRLATHDRALVRTLVVLLAVGAARHEELLHPRSSIVMLPTCYEIMVFPKGGREWKLATIPRSQVIDNLMQMQLFSRLRPAASTTYYAIYKHIKKAAMRYQWPPGKWGTYSIRHGALTLAFDKNVKEKHIRLQTGHQRQIPFTYRRNRNPRREAQMQVVTPVFQAYGLMQAPTPAPKPTHIRTTSTSRTKASSTPRPALPSVTQQKTSQSPPPLALEDTRLQQALVQAQPHTPTSQTHLESPHTDTHPASESSSQQLTYTIDRPLIHRSSPALPLASIRACSLVGALMTSDCSARIFSRTSTSQQPVRAGSALLPSYPFTSAT